MNSLGIAYRILSGPQGPGVPDWQYKISIAVGSGSPALGYRVEKEYCADFLFRFRPWKGWASENADASSVYGILGGIGDEAQALVSEAVERNIADLITHAVCVWSDTPSKVKGATEEGPIWILGPAFPKLIGRIASLRLPSSPGIYWFTPNPLPDWYAEYSSTYRMRPGSAESRSATSEAPFLDEDSLLHTLSTPPPRQCLIQRLSLSDKVENADEQPALGPSSWTGSEAELPNPLRLPTLVLYDRDFDNPLPKFMTTSGDATSEMRRHLKLEDSVISGDAKLALEAVRQGSKDARITVQELDTISNGESSDKSE